MLRAIMYFGPRASVSNLDVIFGRPAGGVCFLLRNSRSITEVTRSSVIQFLHASLSDFLMDPARSREFHFDLGRFESDLACNYTRLIMLFPLTKPMDSLIMAMNGLTDCLRGTYEHPGLLPATLERISIIITEGPKSPLPCLCYAGVNYLLRTLQEVSESGSLRKKLKTIHQRLEPQLTELSDNILVLVRLLGIYSVVTSPNLDLFFRSPPLLCLLEIGQFILDMPNGPEIIQQTLGLPLDYVVPQRHLVRALINSAPMTEIRQSLAGWLSACRRPKGVWGFIPLAAQNTLRPKSQIPQISVEKYTWAWALDTTAFLPDWDGEDSVHYLDLIYSCLHVLFVGIVQPNHVPLGEKRLELASQLLSDYFRQMDDVIFRCRQVRALERILDGIDFTFISQALPTLSTKSYPGLFYLNSVFDKRYVKYPHLHLAEGNPSLRSCLQNIYSHLMQDPTVSHAVLMVYAMFKRLPPKDIEPLLHLAPKLFHSPAMQALFGVGVLQKDDEELVLSSWLPLLLKNGSVKFQHYLPGDYDIDDCIRDAHGHLAIACMEYILSYPGPLKLGSSAESYAVRHWTDHLRYANTQNACLRPC
ncbi:hypothetical protein BD779DRAFT_1571493 [Infundibulicybe gibba]|nr:hypothetical protein BD779DRAFT_1571493 [Infundibulicybe gibba]